MSHQLIAPLGGVQPRLEINTFVKDTHQFSLYVQALNQMQATNQTLIPSWFQVSGIHGLPFIAYDGASVPGFTANPDNQWAGYCTHGSALFPTWHRPYVMLVEQIIYQHAQQIAGTYTTDTNTWKQAAANLRQPYWDWAENIVPPPEVIEYDMVQITVPNGQKQNVTNPLKRYRFHPIDSSFPPPYDQWNTTLRQPDSTDPTATDDVTELRRVLSNSQKSTTRATYQMLTQIQQWGPFSSHTLGPGKGSSNSVESIHDNIHVLVGGNGQMSDPSVAAFDPIFFLHHANVDRLLSIWSAINLGGWLTAGDAQDGTFTLAALQKVDANTDLTPFWKTQYTFWKSNEVPDMTALGYTYPEFKGLNMQNKQSVKNAISKAVNSLYGPRSPPMQRRSFEAGVPIIRDTGLHIGRSHHKRHHEVAERSNRLFDLFTGKFSDWNARVVFDRGEVTRSFSVIFFMGDVPEDPKQWLTSDNFVGAHHAFIHGKQCSECDKNDATEEGFVPLNPYIADHSGLSSFAASLVEPLLTQNLQWRALSTDGTVLNLQSLEVTVLETALDLLPNALFPDVGDIQSFDNITHGRPGGHRGMY